MAAEGEFGFAGTERFAVTRQLGSGDRTLLDESVGALLAMPEIAIPNW